MKINSLVQCLTHIRYFVKYWLELLLPPMQNFRGLERKSTRSSLGCNRKEGCSQGQADHGTIQVYGLKSQRQWIAAQAQLAVSLQRIRLNLQVLALSQTHGEDLVSWSPSEWDWGNSFSLHLLNTSYVLGPGQACYRLSMIYTSQHCEEGAITVPILQMRKLRVRKWKALFKVMQQVGLRLQSNSGLAY